MKVKRLIDFPYTNQSRRYVCGESVIQGFLWYYGVEHLEKEITDAFPFHVEGRKVRKTGITTKEMIKFFERRGLNVSTKVNMTLEQLKQSIDRGVPVIVAVQAWGEKTAQEYADRLRDEHYIIAIGYGGTSEGEPALIFEDPAVLAGTRGWLTEKDFEVRWKDRDYDGEVYDHLGLIVSGKKPEYQNKKLRNIDRGSRAEPR